jgi:hypothetical protein
MKLNAGKTRVIYFSRNTKYEYVDFNYILYNSDVLSTDCIEDLGVLRDYVSISMLIICLLMP